MVTSGKERRICRICGEIFEASSKEMVYGMVARTHSEPSSRCGMNSAPMPRIMTSATISNNSEAPVTRQAYDCRRSSPRTYQLLNFSYIALRRSRTPRRMNSAHSTGSRVSVTSSEPTRAKIMVSAIGLNSVPEGPAST